jgi:hypothetical protein
VEARQSIREKGKEVGVEREKGKKNSGDVNRAMQEEKGNNRGGGNTRGRGREIVEAREEHREKGREIVETRTEYRDGEKENSRTGEEAGEGEMKEEGWSVENKSLVSPAAQV